MLNMCYINQKHLSFVAWCLGPAFCNILSTLISRQLPGCGVRNPHIKCANFFISVLMLFCSIWNSYLCEVTVHQGQCRFSVLDTFSELWIEKREWTRPDPNGNLKMKEYMFYARFLRTESFRNCRVSVLLFCIIYPLLFLRRFTSPSLLYRLVCT